MDQPEAQGSDGHAHTEVKHRRAQGKTRDERAKEGFGNQQGADDDAGQGEGGGLVHARCSRPKGRRNGLCQVAVWRGERAEKAGRIMSTA